MPDIPLGSADRVLARPVGAFDDSLLDLATVDIKQQVSAERREVDLHKVGIPDRLADGVALMQASEEAPWFIENPSRVVGIEQAERSIEANDQRYITGREFTTPHRPGRKLAVTLILAHQALESRGRLTQGKLPFAVVRTVLHEPHTLTGLRSRVRPRALRLCRRQPSQREGISSMAGPIEHFCLATQRWTERTSMYEMNDVLANVARYTGVDPTDMLTLSELRGRLNTLVDSVGLDEPFLVYSLVQSIEREFDWLADNMPDDLEPPTAMVTHLEMLAADAARRDAYIRSKNQEIIDTWQEPFEPFTDETLDTMIEQLRVRNTGDSDDRKAREEQRDIWHEVTEPIRDVLIEGRLGRWG